MKKYWLLILLLFIPFKIFALEDINLYSKSYVIYDVTDDKILYTKNETERRSIASLTKIMSSIVAIENIDNLDAKVTITQDMLNTVPWDALVIHLKAGEELTYRDLLYATLLPSAADSVNSLAIAVGGDLPSFVKKMNDKAKELGLNDTSFENPIGMDHKNNYSTYSDLLKILKYALSNSTFKTVFETKEYTLTNGMKVTASAKDFGDKIGVSTDRIIGDKTGFTDPAEFCIAYEFTSHDHMYYTVLLGAPVENFTDYKHIRDANTVIDYITDNYEYKNIVKKDTLYKEIDVVDSTIDKYSIYYDNDITLLLPKDYDMNNIKIEDDLPVNISYKNNKDEQIGVIKYYNNDELLYTQNVIIKDSIKPNLESYIKIHLIEIIILIFIIVSLILLTRFVIKRHK